MRLLPAPRQPARTTTDPLGTRRTYDDSGRLHDADGPAVLDLDGYAEHWSHGELLAVLAPPLAA